MCKSQELNEFLDLGYSPLADCFRLPNESRETEIFYPLSVLSCGNCGLAQLNCVVPATELYNDKYLYDCSVTSSGMAHWQEFAQSIVANYALGKDSFVVDIGSNVGALLENFKKLGLRTCGVEPAPRIATIAQSRGITTLNTFFDENVALQLKKEFGPARVITATNVFAHIDDLDSFMRAIKTLLHPEGVFVIEFPYLLELVRTIAYDTVYHEHLSYLSIKPLANYLLKHGLVISSIDPQRIHGGSLRIGVRFQEQSAQCGEVRSYIEQELREGLYDPIRLKTFAQEVRNSQRELVALLKALRQEGKKVVAVSAPAKGMSLLNICGIDFNLIDFISEKSELKVGLQAPGIPIPIVPDQKLREAQPDYCLLLAWNFKEEIMRNLSFIANWGGKFIIPLPRPTIMEP